MFLGLQYLPVECVHGVLFLRHAAAVEEIVLAAHHQVTELPVVDLQADQLPAASTRCATRGKATQDWW